MLPDGTQQKLWDQAEVDLAKERLQFAAKLQQVTHADNDSLTSVSHWPSITQDAPDPDSDRTMCL